ncbi:MAG: SUMF1/EgtB/PvdO family nonheme iron enzyme [Blastocatellia bacterium]|nr:SUMF1/EgtB/PvdO family nonheme iron enzyme [Blastocatellia bacterium]
MGAIMNKPPNPLPSDIPAQLQKIVWQALEKKMEERFQAAADMRQALLRFNYSPASPKPTLPEPAPRRNIIQIDFEPPSRPTPPQSTPRVENEPTHIVSPNPPLAAESDRIVVDKSDVEKLDFPKPYIENLNGVPLEMILVSAGKFTMGSDNYIDEKPLHDVRVQSFYMGRFQITQAQWKAVMGEKVKPRFYGNNLPMESVSLSDAKSFCKKLRAMTGKAFRLPSEAEWEYTCRAGTTGDYAGNLDEMAWYSKNSDGKTHPVGQKNPNAFGLYDMHGNVWEWCEDVWNKNYNEAPQDGSAWADGFSQVRRVLRGGSWHDEGDSCRSAYRGSYASGGRSKTVGFRVVMSTIAFVSVKGSARVTQVSVLS